MSIPPETPPAQPTPQRDPEYMRQGHAAIDAFVQGLLDEQVDLEELQRRHQTMAGYFRNPIGPPAPDSPATPGEQGRSPEQTDFRDRPVWVSAESKLLSGREGGGREGGYFDPEAPEGQQIKANQSFSALPRTVSDLLNLRQSAQMGVPPRYNTDGNGSLIFDHSWSSQTDRDWRGWKPELPQNAEGRRVVNPYMVVVDGYTILSFGVPGGSNRENIYNFAFRGEIPYAEAVARAEATFPEIIKDATDKGYALPDELADGQLVDVEELRPALMEKHQEWKARQDAVRAQVAARQRDQAGESGETPASEESQQQRKPQTPGSNTPGFLGRLATGRKQRRERQERIQKYMKPR